MGTIIDFYQNIHKIKHIEREGWKKIGIKGVKDTIASHSFGASILAWAMSKSEGFSSDRLIKMLLIHDLIMARVKDYMPEHVEYKDKRVIENSLADELIDDVPEMIKSEFSGIFKEYQDEKTELAIFARECDKLDTILQAYMYSKELDKDEFSKFVESYNQKIRSKTGKKMVKEMLQSFA